MSTSPAVAEQYRFAVDSFIDLARTLDDAASTNSSPDGVSRRLRSPT